MAIALVGPQGSEIEADVPCTDGATEAARLAMARLFFATDQGSVRLAKRMCARCPAAAECLAGALQRNEHDGVWGGTTPKDRRQLRARLNAQAARAS